MWRRRGRPCPSSPPPVPPLCRTPTRPRSLSYLLAVCPSPSPPSCSSAFRLSARKSPSGFCPSCHRPFSRWDRCELTAVTIIRRHDRPSPDPKAIAARARAGAGGGGRVDGRFGGSEVSSRRARAMGRARRRRPRRRIPQRVTWNVEAPYETGFVFSSVDGVSTLYRTRVLSTSMRGEDDLFIVRRRLGN